MTCWEIQSPGGCHVSTCLGVCALNPRMPGSRVATVLDRISFRKAYLYGSPPRGIEGSLLLVGLCPVSAITQEPSENSIAFLERLKEALQKFTNLDLDL